MVEITQHNVEIQANLGHWKRKPALRQVYRDFYQKIAAWVSGRAGGATLELGSGMGNIKEVIPDCITSDLFPNPWLDREENVYALKWPEGSVENLILFDVFHHLRYPGSAFKEMARVVRPGGRVILFEPGMGWLPRQILRFFHYEPLGFGQPIEWDAPAEFNPEDHAYHASQGNCWRVFVEKEDIEQRVLGEWKVLHVGREPGWCWLLSGGLSGPQLYPDFLLPALRFLEKGLSVLPSVFSGRMLVVLERKA